MKKSRFSWFGAFSIGGIALGLLFFSLSLTPSLTPRTTTVAGVLGGMIAAMGYAGWSLSVWTWDWLGLPVPNARRLNQMRLAFLAASVAAAAHALARASAWQDSIRLLWGLPPLETIAPFTLVGIAIPVFAAIAALWHAFIWVILKTAMATRSFVPSRVASAIGFVLAVALFSTLFSGVLMRGGLKLLDGTAAAADAFVSPDLPQPQAMEKTGSRASQIAWEDLGRWGRSFVVTAPTASEISAFWGEPAIDPIRVYVGLSAEGSPRQRAELALSELIRQGAFEREILVIAVPTGSGWLDPGSHDALEYMHRGDVATVAVQYSYLSSWISLLADPRDGLQEAQELFEVVYRYWTGLPRDGRPRLYLHGLSLGAFLSQSTVPLLDVLGDPFHGAMWAGSPFLSEFWRYVAERREPKSPAWRPDFGNGSLIRTMNQEDRPATAATPWGPIRLVFLQYASDPIVFFDRSLMTTPPDWLKGERGPDVSPLMRWLPLVTMLQVGLDMAISLGVPGYGHDYIADHYILAWAATTDPAGWTEERQQALRVLFAGRMAR